MFWKLLWVSRNTVVALEPLACRHPVFSALLRLRGSTARGREGPAQPGRRAVCAVARGPSLRALRAIYGRHLMLTFASKCCLRELCVFTPLSAWKNTPGLHPPWIPTSRKFFQVCSTLETWLLGRWLQNELRGCPKS